MTPTQQLLTGANYALNAYSGITNTGSTVIAGGNIGSFPTSTETGFPPGVLSPPAIIDNANSLQARLDALAAYNTFAALSFTSLGAASVNLSVSGNGSTASTYTPGNYSAGTSMDIPTSITLDAQGNPNAVFIFKAGSTVTLESGASVLLINGAAAQNVVWLVGSSFTSIFAGVSVMVGNILAQVSATLGGGVLSGRVLAGLGNSSGAITVSSAEAITVPVATIGGTPTKTGAGNLCLISQNLGASVLTAWPQVTPNSVSSQFLDLIQIVQEGDDVDTAPMVLNVDYTGAVHYPAINPTNGTRIGQWFTRLGLPANGIPTATLAAVMADTFTNPSLLDIIQVINLGGNISYWWDYLGLAHGS
jgi:hypothetical protein